MYDIIHHTLPMPKWTLFLPNTLCVSLYSMYNWRRIKCSVLFAHHFQSDFYFIIWNFQCLACSCTACIVVVLKRWSQFNWLFDGSSVKEIHYVRYTYIYKYIYMRTINKFAIMTFGSMAIFFSSSLFLGQLNWDLSCIFFCPANSNCIKLSQLD